MDKKCFCRAYRYSEKENKSPLENFTTEIFVFVWNYLIETNKTLAKELFSLFGVNTVDLSQIHIETQQEYTELKDKNLKPKNFQKAKPDITIFINESELYFIEVKVNQKLEKYNLPNRKQIDQVNRYQNIKNAKQVYTLTKNYVDTDNLDNQHKIRWFQIYDILKKDESIVVQNFLTFLEEHDMGERKPITKNSIDILRNLNSLLDIIKTAWDDADIKKYSLKDKSYHENNGIGYYESNESFFIGLLPEEKFANKICFWVDYWNEETIIPKEKHFIDENNNFVLSDMLDITDLIGKTFSEQVNIVRDWLVENVKPLLEKSKSK